jgi:hypothetical protein
MNEIDRLSEFLQRLTPLSRSCLLSELERLELCGIDMPGSADVQARLRAEFRKDGSTQARATSPSRYFFAPLELLLIDGAPEHPNMGRISRNTSPRSGSGSAATCCRPWRATTSRRSTTRSPPTTRRKC